MSNWTIIGNSVAGSSHRARGRGCDDSHGWSQGEGFMCLAVADGAGSEVNSASGSEVAVRTVLRWTKELDSRVPSPVDLPCCFKAALESLEKLAKGEGIDPSTFATTLGVVVIRDGKLTVGQVGDTIIVIRHADGELETVSPAERFEYVNETVFITSDSAFDHLRLAEMDAADITGIALSTDGLRYMILSDLETYVPYGPFFEDVFAYAASGKASNRAVAKYLNGLDDQSGDDKTLVVATFDAEVAIGAETEVVGPLDRKGRPDKSCATAAAVPEATDAPVNQALADPLLPSEEGVTEDDVVGAVDQDDVSAG